MYLPSAIRISGLLVWRSENREENEHPGRQKALYLYPTTNNQILETSDISILVKKGVIMWYKILHHIITLLSKILSLSYCSINKRQSSSFTCTWKAKHKGKSKKKWVLNFRLLTE